MRNAWCIRAAPTIRPSSALQDFVIVCLKAHSITGVIEQMQPLLGPHTRIVTAVNGIPYWYFYKHGGAIEDATLESIDPGGRQWRELGAERAIGCIVYPATEIEAPGVIRHVYGNHFPLGEPSGEITDDVQRPRRRLRHGRHEGAGARSHPRRDLAQAVGQCLLQPDQRADACDARRDLHRSRDPRAVEGDHAGDARRSPKPSASSSASMSSAASKARARSARTRPRCCRTSSAAGRWRSIRW